MGQRQPCQQGGDRQRIFAQLQVRRGEAAAQIFRRTWAGRWTVQARQENSSRGHADETAGDMRAAATLGLKWGASWPEVLPASMTRFPAGDDPIPSSAGLDTVGAVLESAAPTKSAESAAGAGDESGQSTARRERLLESADSAAVSASAALACWRGGLMRVGTWAAGSESKSFPEPAGKNAPRDGRVR